MNRAERHTEMKILVRIARQRVWTTKCSEKKSESFVHELALELDT